MTWVISLIVFKGIFIAWAVRACVALVILSITDSVEERQGGQSQEERRGALTRALQKQYVSDSVHVSDMDDVEESALNIDSSPPGFNEPTFSAFTKSFGSALYNAKTGVKNHSYTSIIIIIIIKDNNSNRSVFLGFRLLNSIIQKCFFDRLVSDIRTYYHPKNHELLIHVYWYWVQCTDVDSTDLI